MEMKTNLAVIGDPIAHSLSPVIHTTVLEELGLEYNYEKIRVPKGGLLPFLKAEQCCNLTGFNLTMPHKQDVISFLDFVDGDARIFDAVNTVKVENHRLSGYNTDGNGCLLAMKEKGFECIGKNAVIFGAGGVVSTIALKMVLEGAERVVVLNRTLKAAEELAEKVLARTGKKIITGGLTAEKMTQYCENSDVLINGTPLGMEGIDRDFEDLSFLDALPKDALVYDLIYRPEKTELLKNAERRGLQTLNGLGMLIYQGLLADEIFLETTLNFPPLKTKIEQRIRNFNI